MKENEFLANSAEVLNAVAAGESFRISRDGREIAELRPVGSRRRLIAAELVERHRRLLRVDAELLRREADEYFGGPDD